MNLYYYRAFLVLMTTQSSLQYSFTFTQSHTHSYSASISSTLLFYEGQFRVQLLAQGHFGMQIYLGRLGRLNCRLSGWRTTTLPPQPQWWGWAYTCCFSRSFYEKQSWLTGSDVNNAFYCFTFLLFHPQSFSFSIHHWFTTRLIDKKPAE